MVRGAIPGGSNIFFPFSKASRSALGPSQSQWGGKLFHCGKSRRGARLTTHIPSNVEFRNEWS